MRNFGFFVLNFWFTLTGLNNAVVPQKRKLSGMNGQVTQHIPTMTDSYHGGVLSVMIMVGICQVTNSHHLSDDEEIFLVQFRPKC